jgi:hypothetical protein
MPLVPLVCLALIHQEPSGSFLVLQPKSASAPKIVTKLGLLGVFVIVTTTPKTEAILFTASRSMVERLAHSPATKPNNKLVPRLLHKIVPSMVLPVPLTPIALIPMLALKTSVC